MAVSSDVLVVGSDRFEHHIVPVGHPERPERASVMTRVADRWGASGGRLIEPSPTSKEALCRVHSAAYVETLIATSGQNVRLDPDTYVSPKSEWIARLAAGAAVLAVDHVIEHNSVACAFVRPPGHHAETKRAMGFCLYNNVAVAAAHALDHGLDRVAIVDYDVHHGNGTQWIFYDDPRVLYVSTHQYPFYPGTGSAEEVGMGDGRGFTANVPLEAGATDADLDLVFRRVVVPILMAFDADLVLLSAGFDAHFNDPLGGMRLSTSGFATLTRRLREVARLCCHGRMAIVTEGGYDLQALEECLEMTLSVSSEERPLIEAAIAGETPAGDASLSVVLPALRSFWPTL